MSSFAGTVPAPDRGVGALLAAVLSVGLQPPGARRGSGRVLTRDRATVPETSDVPPGPEDGRDEEVWGLVEAAQRGDTEAFGQLYDRYVDVVHRYAYARLGDRTLAEDVTSETFLRALRRIGTVSYRGRDVGAWFVTIARNLVLDHVKSGRNRYEVVSGEPLEPSVGVEGPEPAVLRRLSAEELLRCVRQLPPDQQECVVLRFLQGLSVAETAAVMERNVGAVKALQHRALRRLAGSLPDGLR
ncbi:MAG TPA: sigma-70 family RNA polymerase sigma factor [Mycobacteriales bacterium]|nr:sigma-70 family RNA polymerase sigma factor [Mycobacteriales bacterium]